MPRFEAVCRQCGKPFVSGRRSHAQGAPTFCSQACKAESMQGRAWPHTADAHAAIRGKRRSDADLCRRALGIQRKAVLSDDEAEIFGVLWEIGLRPIPQLAVGKYNVDFGFPEEKLAVEYNGGNWHAAERKRRQDGAKERFLAEHGWRLLVFPMLDRPRLWGGGGPKIALSELVAEVVHALGPPTAPRRSG